MPKFECIVEQPSYNGSAFALNMNQRILKIIAGIETATDKKKYREQNSILKHYEISDQFVIFLFQNELCELKEKFIDDSKFLQEKSRSIKQIQDFCKTPITINVAGKNFARFDWDFIYKLPKWSSLVNFSQRIIDPAVLYADWKNDKRLPNLSDCKKRAELAEDVSHKAIEDAWDVIQLMRKTTNNYENN